MSNGIVSATLEIINNATYRITWLVFSVLVFWSFLWWSFGFVPAFGQGFARAERLDYVLELWTEDSIIESRLRYCTAKSGSPSKQYFLRATQHYANEYRKATGTSYPIPSCEELVGEL